jgi:hypothetical protein
MIALKLRIWKRYVASALQCNRYLEDKHCSIESVLNYRECRRFVGSGSMHGINVGVGVSFSVSVTVSVSVGVFVIIHAHFRVHSSVHVQVHLRVRVHTTSKVHRHVH